MTRLRIDTDYNYGEIILSNQKLGQDVRRYKWVTVGLAMVVATSAIIGSINSNKQQKPLLLDTQTGQIITDYKHVLETYTVEERLLLARLSYEGLRRRTGNKNIDGQVLDGWSGQITKGGLTAWRNLGERWKNPNLVETGVRRTIEVLSVVPDNATPYAYTIEALETDSVDNKPMSEHKYRVRLTLRFTDPAINGQSKIDGVILHAEDAV